MTCQRVGFCQKVINDFVSPKFIPVGLSTNLYQAFLCVNDLVCRRIDLYSIRILLEGEAVGQSTKRFNEIIWPIFSSTTVNRAENIL